MYRLGLQLILQGGREAIVRLILTAAAVAIGVMILLGVFADFHAFQKTSDRQSWESTNGTPVTSVPKQSSGTDLWNYSENIYKGQFIEQLDVAALHQNSPVLPGISKMPQPGQFYASPALSNLLKTVSSDELGNRFPGVQIGTIGENALSFPTELAIYDGIAPNTLVKLNGTIAVTNIATAVQLQGTTNIYREAFGIGALAILFPLLILINTATRLSSARREERYAAMRLVGATPHQINVIASTDAICGSLIGAVGGCLLFLLVRPSIANISFSGVKFFSNYVTPTIWGYIGLIVAVPILAAIASLISLRRVRITPLGVSRKTTPKKPGMWGLIPLFFGIILFPFAAANVSGKSNGTPLPLFVGFLLIMIGIIMTGSWLTMVVTSALAGFANNAPSLLASRRLSDNPKAAFRTISGLVLAVFIGAVVSILVPALNYAQDPTGETSLSNLLRVPYNTEPLSAGLSPQDGSKLIAKLKAYPRTIVIPIYSNPAFLAFQQSTFQAQGSGNKDGNGPQMLVGPNANVQPPNDSVVSCSSIEQISELGSCPPGAKAVTFESDSLLGGDNPLYIYQSLPIINSHSDVSSLNLSHQYVAGLLVKPNNATTLEKIRTYLTVYGMSHNGNTNKSGSNSGGNDLSSWQMGVFEPETLGEVAEIRNNDDSNVGRAVFAVIALTIITAGCSLSVTVGGSLVERKRSFTLLRVSGVSLRTLYTVVLLEAALPMIAISVLAGAIGLGVGVPVIKSLLKNFEPKGTTIPVHPSTGFYIAYVIGLVVALCLVLITLPILNRITKPEDVRFE